MTSIALILLLVSSFLHVAWNLIAKGNKGAGFEVFKIAVVVGNILLLPFILLNYNILFSIDLKSIIILLITGLFQYSYFYGLNRSFAKGDLSLIYPIVRAIPVVLVAVIRLLIFHVELNKFVFVGISFIVLGCLIIPLKEIRRDNLSRLIHTFRLFTFITIIGTTGYTLVDSLGLSHFLNIMTTYPAYMRSILYLFSENISTLIWMLLLNNRTNRISVYLNKDIIIKGSLMGMGITITYLLILISMNYVSDVTYVAAMRQLSIPIGVIIGITVLKEPAYFPRILGMILIFAGLLITSV